MEEKGAYSLGSEEIINLICDPCKHDGQDIEAMGFCVNCQEFLCGGCCKYHTKPLPCRDHTILNKEDMPKKKPLKSSPNVDGKVSISDSVFDECLKHEGEYLKYYCGDHTDFGCTVCMTIGHRSCEDVQYIPEVAKTVKDSTEFKNFEQTLINLAETAYENANKAKSNKNQLERSYNETMEQVEDFRIKINDTLDKLQSEIKLKTEKLALECMYQINGVEKEVCEVAEQISNLKVDVESFSQTAQNVKLFMKIKRSKDETKSLGSAVKQTRDRIRATELQFTPDVKLQEIVNGIQSFGNCVQIMSNEGNTLTYLRDISVRSPTDKKICNIIDLVMLSGHLLVLADKANRKAKVLDMNVGKISAEHVICEIRAITRIDDNTVAVAYPNTVGMFSITENSFTAGRKIYINNCHNLLYQKGTHHLMAMLTNPKEIVAIDLKSTVIKTMKPSIMFTNAGCITQSSDEETVYITDAAKPRVFSCTIEGVQKAVYKAKTLQEPRGMAVTEDGIVYVCGYQSNTVHTLLPEIGTMHIVLDSTNGIQYPTCVAVNDVGQQIIVGSENNDVVKVFEY